MSELLSLIAFLANLVFFIWFGATLSSINQRLGHIADHAGRQTKLLASIANATISQATEGDSQGAQT